MTSTHRPLPSFPAQRGISLLLFSALVLFAALPASAQVATGTPPFGSFGGGPDIVNLANLNVHWTTPVLHKPGRGTNFTYDLSYDSSVWYPVTSGSTRTWQLTSANIGWTTSLYYGGYVSHSTSLSSYRTYCGLHWTPQYAYITTYTYSNWSYFDGRGTPHPYPSGDSSYMQTNGCTDDTSYGYFSDVSIDGSGYKLTVSGSSVVSLYASNGGLVTLGGNLPYQDRNGNQITTDGSGHFYDTLSSTTPVLTVSGSGTPSSPMTFTYTAPSGANASYTMKFTTYSLQTNFGCSGITEYGTNGTTTANLVSEIDLPDYNATTNPNSKYSFTYEPTPNHSGFVTGRLASVTLPTGGTISYFYSAGNNGINCSDGSAATLTSTTPDGTWTYAQVKNTGAASTTTVTDPSGNNTVVQFQGIYETQRQIYQGSVAPANLLRTINTCYNGAASPCTGTAIAPPVTHRSMTNILPGGLQSEHDDSWNTYGGPTETDDYDYGAAPHGPLLKKVLANYATLGNITAFRQSVTIQNGSGTTVSQINYNYDETTPTTTSGIPQHVSVTGPRGNLTSVNTYTNATNFLTRKSSYYDTGTVSATTDVNNAVTTYTYTAGAASCYNTFPTSINEAVSGLSTSATWNCTGGVQLTSVDENNQATTTTYNDPYFWRPASVADPTGAITNSCYGLLASGTCNLNPNQAESYMTFNSGNSTVDTLTTVDGLGRAHVQQTRQAPGSSNFDSMETDYDALGRVSRVTLPYSGTAGQTNSSVAATTTTYDALGRPLTVLDGGNGSTSYFYGNTGSQNQDVLITRSPAPTGENTKRRQLEFDALGRLTSACELTAGTTAWPGGNCAQTTAQTGYWTKYTYDPMGNLMTVTQNAQSTSNQTRSYTYDWMNRMTSETVPEIGAGGNGTATYTFDSDATCGTYTGDLVKRVDAAGDVICSTFDALHRELTRNYPSGTYASVTPQKHFVYDTATVNSVAMANAKARLAEAYTCFSPCTTKLTDIGLSYTVRGETSDSYESTPNSGAYYHAAQSYWANRAPNQLTGNIGLPATITYNPDGKGRVNSVSASSGQNPLSSTTYNTAGLPTAINLGSGSGDADSYTWDPSTNRMTQYKFTVNGTSLTGALGWNANATLQTQNITDGFNSASTQNCSYQYDDITRVTSANCGSAAAQTFSYDPFGNINKSGSPYSFQPTYATATNRIMSLNSFTPTYDSNGNLTNDNLHNFAWDADGHAIAVDAGLSDAVNLTYDALGRMVEQKRGSTYTQIVYSPTGQKLALMSGSTLQKGIVALVGQAQAVYNSSGLLYYAHPDLLGSIRLATTPTSRTIYFDTAYAPFGETYASAGGANLDPAYTGQMADTAHRQDTAGGLYDFPAREYSIQGRWPSPDPAGVSATCTKNPQTQNRYAYVTNNPLSYVDPLGTALRYACPFDVCGVGGGGGGGGCDPFLNPEGCPPPPCDPFMDPLCFGGCDPTVDPTCGIGGGGGGGGGFLSGSTGDKTKTVEKNCGRCGDCPCDSSFSSFLCRVLSYLYPCGERGPAQGCEEKISKAPGNTGNQCAGMTPPLVFIEEWSCAGDAPCCMQKYTAYMNKCYDAGNQPVNVPALFGGVPGLQCCKLSKSPK
jgi:RHS repeat-associated protein